jgi:hypothetical protein
MAAEPFQVVLDESGYKAADPKHPNDVFVFAGYIGKVADWTSFTRAWQPIFEKYPELHKTKVVKQLMRWTGPYSSPLALALIKSVVENNGLGSIRWRLPYANYRKAVPTQILGGDENIYVFAWFMVLMLTVGIIARFPDATLDLIYDQNIAEEPKVQSGYMRLRSFIQAEYPDVARRLPYRPRPEDDSGFWPLRAADALAWNTHRHYTQTQRRRRFGNPLWTLLDSGPEALNITFTEQDVRDVLQPPEEPFELIKRRANELWKSITKEYSGSR